MRGCALDPLQDGVMRCSAVNVLSLRICATETRSAEGSWLHGPGMRVGIAMAAWEWAECVQLLGGHGEASRGGSPKIPKKC